MEKKWGDNYSDGLSICEEYGMKGECGIKCPLFKKGQCEIQEDTCSTIEKQLKVLEEIKQEHFIMEQIIVENGLWETLLNDDRFIEYLKS